MSPIWHVAQCAFFSLGFVLRGFKNKSEVCHVFCEELFMLGATHSQVDVETEFGALSLILIFFYEFSLR